jgi:hypothetical protein
MCIDIWLSICLFSNFNWDKPSYQASMTPWKADILVGRRGIWRHIELEISLVISTVPRILEVPEFRLLYHTVRSTLLFRSTVLALDFILRFRNKTNSPPKCRFFIGTVIDRSSLREKINLDIRTFWLLLVVEHEWHIFICPYSCLGLMTEADVSGQKRFASVKRNSEAFRFTEAKIWSVSLHWSKNLKRFASLKRNDRTILAERNSSSHEDTYTNCVWRVCDERGPEREKTCF